MSTEEKGSLAIPCTAPDIGYVEAMSDRSDLIWRTSSRSGGGSCVQIAADTDQVLIRDSKNPAGPVLSFDRTAFREFITFVKESAR